MMRQLISKSCYIYNLSSFLQTVAINFVVQNVVKIHKTKMNK